MHQTAWQQYIHSKYGIIHSATKAAVIWLSLITVLWPVNGCSSTYIQSCISCSAHHDIKVLKDVGRPRQLGAAALRLLLGLEPLALRGGVDGRWFFVMRWHPLFQLLCTATAPGEWTLHPRLECETAGCITRCLISAAAPIDNPQIRLPLRLTFASVTSSGLNHGSLPSGRSFYRCRRGLPRMRNEEVSQQHTRHQQQRRHCGESSASCRAGARTTCCAAALRNAAAGAPTNLTPPYTLFHVP